MASENMTTMMRRRWPFLQRDIQAKEMVLAWCAVLCVVCVCGVVLCVWLCGLCVVSVCGVVCPLCVMCYVCVCVCCVVCALCCGVLCACVCVLWCSTGSIPALQ